MASVPACVRVAALSSGTCSGTRTTASTRVMGAARSVVPRRLRSRRATPAQAVVSPPRYTSSRASPGQPGPGARPEPAWQNQQQQAGPGARPEPAWQTQQQQGPGARPEPAWQTQQQPQQAPAQQQPMHYQPMQPQYPQPAQYAPPPQQYVQQPAQSPQLFFQPQQQPQAWNNSALNQGARPGLHGAPQRGEPTPLGATASTRATNFALFSSSARAVSLLLFTAEDRAAGRITVEIELDPASNKSGDVWHVSVPNLHPDLLYAYRVSGPSAPPAGPGRAGQAQRFVSDFILLDPYAKSVVSREAFAYPDPDGSTWVLMATPVPLPPKYEVPFDWDGVGAPNYVLEDLVVYELHVRGFTQDRSSGVVYPGTYSGVIEKIPHLQRMGFNAIELLPIQEFNECEYFAPVNPATGGVYCNFWGYSPVNHFSPMARYSANPGEDCGRGVVREVKEMVKACHEAGIEVIMNIVFTHTAEGNEAGPTICFRGLDNHVYYMMAPDGSYYNFSGCGNTLNTDHPVVRQFVIDCLHYWATEYEVDGFRLDLKAISDPEADEEVSAEGAEGPGADGAKAAPKAARRQRPAQAGPPLIEIISKDEVLRSRKIISEPLNKTARQQLEALPRYDKWSERNAGFRNTMRNFVKGTDGCAGAFAERVCGSPAAAGASATEAAHRPRHSLNYITSHDGFTLSDLVAYTKKQNGANGEENRDGEEDNLSWNCGGEKDDGPSTDVNVLELRRRQKRNFLAALFLSQGVPVLHMGDEYGHSKFGNNNTYCHDSPLNYFLWDEADLDEEGLMRFCSVLIHFRKATPALRLRNHPTGSQIQWHGHVAGEPNWEPESRFVAFTLSDGTGSAPLYVAFNADYQPAVLRLPEPGTGRRWKLLMDTALPSPYDIVATDVPADMRQAAEAQHLKTLRGNMYFMTDRSTILLRSEPLV